MPTIAVRLAGGLGDHLLGMRLLKYVYWRYPHHKIVAYSDAEGSVAQVEVAWMSPYVAEVDILHQDSMRVTEENVGSLANLTSESLMKLRGADLFFDAHTAPQFVYECCRLNVPHFEVLSSRPDLAIPPQALDAAQALVDSLPCKKFVALNIMKYGPELVRHYVSLAHAFLAELLKDPEVGVFHFYVRGYDFPHVPEPIRTYRERTCALEAAELEGLASSYSDRVFPMINQSVPAISSLLKRCSYFVGVDNGVKHLAWALGIPHVWLSPGGYGKEFILRWAPDYHCMIEAGPQCDVREIGLRLASRIRNALSRERQTAPGVCGERESHSRQGASL